MKWRISEVDRKQICGGGIYKNLVLLAEAEEKIDFFFIFIAKFILSLLEIYLGKFCGAT